MAHPLSDRGAARSLIDSIHNHERVIHAQAEDDEGQDRVHRRPLWWGCGGLWWVVMGRGWLRWVGGGEVVVAGAILIGAVECRFYNISNRDVF